jgi:formylglycine-generating enzyme required for sulfatase activity
VSAFRLDKYDVTVGRFRQFVEAWNGGAGWMPTQGSGKHTHLNGGQGLANSGSGAGNYEAGWATSDNGNISPTDTNLACDSPNATWTNASAGNEKLPINCVNWWESYAFCIWDGGFLPSETEWEYAAAGGSQQREYPWGSTAPGSTNQYAIYNCDYLAGGNDCIAAVGTATLGAGLWGQLDLAGNLWQWPLDWYANYENPCADCAYLTVSSYRVHRGGCFANSYSSDLLATNRVYDPPTVRGMFFGFRCARTP